MILQKSEDFLADVEHQFEWYVVKGGWDLAEHYLHAVEATCPSWAIIRCSAQLSGSGIRG